MRKRATKLVALLGRLPDTTMRVAVLEETLRGVTHEEGATLIAELLRASQQHQAGRTARIALALALGSDDPALRRAAEGIRSEADARGDEAVGNLLRSRSAYRAVRPDHLPAPPAGSPSRELTLGERRALARRPDRRSLAKLMIDPDPRVIRNLLRNPRLTEDDVIRVAARRPCRSDVLAEIYASKRWIARPRVQLALVLNPYNRTDIALRLLAGLARDCLKQAATERTIDPLVRHAALAALGATPAGVLRPRRRRRPPELSDDQPRGGPSPTPTARRGDPGPEPRGDGDNEPTGEGEAAQAHAAPAPAERGAAPDQSVRPEPVRAHVAVVDVGSADSGERLTEA